MWSTKCCVFGRFQCLSSLCSSWYNTLRPLGKLVSYQLILPTKKASTTFVDKSCFHYSSQTCSSETTAYDYCGSVAFQNGMVEIDQKLNTNHYKKVSLTLRKPVGNEWCLRHRSPVICELGMLWVHQPQLCALIATELAELVKVRNGAIQIALKVFKKLPIVRNTISLKN